MPSSEQGSNDYHPIRTRIARGAAAYIRGSRPKTG